MHLTVKLDKKGQLTSASIRLQNGEKTRKARAEIKGNKVIVTLNGDMGKSFDSKEPLVLATTAPDWSDIILLLRQYDQKKSGKQTFTGLWFHPTQPSHLRTFTVERSGDIAIQKGEKTKALGKFTVTLRSGGYEVWADAQGRVYRIMKPQRPQNAIVLEGYENWTLKK